MIATSRPSGLNSDADQRLLGDEEMSYALNVTLASNGDGTDSVVKNLNGTTPLGPLPTTDRIPDGETVRIIGSVSDSQRRFIYWFVAGRAGDASENAIYQHDVAAGKYRVVYKSSWWAFNPNGFVKADVVNGAFQQDGRIETILYFTDNENPPRKINVDRAIAGDYSGLSSNAEREYAFSSIVAPHVREPLFNFVTDANIKSNDLTGKLFQFATQIIYTDGEESAISPYSELAFSNNTAIGPLDEVGFGRLVNEDNVCEIITRSSISSGVSSLGASINMPDATKLRVLARQGNVGTFFVIDEFPIGQDLQKNIRGVDTTVFNAQTGVYRFYNDGVYSFVPSSTEDKQYDNVPFLAQGQAVAKNRLVYSNYTEGRANFVPDADLSVVYSNTSGGNESEDASGVTEDTAAFDIDADLSSLFAGASTVVPAGTTTIVQFNFNPVGTFEKTSDFAVDIFGTADPISGSDYSVTLSLGNSAEANTDDIPITSSSAGYVGQVVVTNESDVIRTELGALFVSAFEDGGFVYTQTQSQTLTSQVSAQGAGGNFSVGDLVTLGSRTCTYQWKFDDVSYTAGTGVIQVNPYISFFAIDIDTTPLVTSGVDDITLNTQSFISSISQSSLSYTMTDVLGSGLNVINTSAGFSQTSFKAGCMHDLGIVYYDEFNRSGNVNKLGSVYVNGFWERSATEYGAAAVTINFDNGSNAPLWAERFQVVYGGMSTYSDFTTYTAARGMAARYGVPGTPTSPYDTNNRTVYLDMSTLDTFRTEKGALKEYSFTEGDKLRVISYDSTAGGGAATIVYPTANNTALPIEFDVVGVETFTTADTVLGYGGAPTGVAGTFLKLAAPSVSNATDADGVAGGEQIQYDGFDWYSITDTAYPNTDASSDTNHWHKRCLVEILSPRKSTSEDVYYEIGSSYAVGSRKSGSYSTHGAPITVSNSEVHFRRTACKSPTRNGGGVWTVDTPEDYVYNNIFTETLDVSDYFNSRHWSKGRAHVVYGKAAEINRFNGVTYSDEYAEDVSNLALSSFNPSNINFISLNSKYGGCRYITDYSDGLAFVQENKLSFASMGRGIIQTADGGTITALSTEVVGPIQYMGGDFGCGVHPESVFAQDSIILFADSSRKKILLFDGRALSPISDIDISQALRAAFNNLATQSVRKIITGYNPQDNVYYVTMKSDDSGSYVGSTYAFNSTIDRWESEVSFHPDFYSNQDDDIFSALFDDPAGTDDTEWLYSHKNAAQRNNFYGTQFASVIEVIFNAQTTSAKSFNAVSVNGTGLTNNMIGIATSSAGQTTVPFTFVEKEGTRFSAVPKASNGSTSNIIPVGRISDVTGSSLVLEFHNSIRGLSLPIGSSVVYVNDTGAMVNVGTNVTLVSADYEASTITMSGVGTSDATLIAAYADGALQNGVDGKDVYLVTNTSVDGDDIRGHYMSLVVSEAATTPLEIFTLNAEYVESKLNHV
jgi:hypothetical protein